MTSAALIIARAARDEAAITSYSRTVSYTVAFCEGRGVSSIEGLPDPDLLAYAEGVKTAVRQHRPTYGPAPGQPTRSGNALDLISGAQLPSPDPAETARRRAAREAEADDARREANAEREESERITLAEQMATGAAMRSYREQGGRAHIRWEVRAVPLDIGDPVAGVDGNERRAS